MPKYIINDLGVVLNPEKIVIWESICYRHVIIKYAEINNVFYAGYSVNCNDHGAASGVGTINSPKKFATKIDAISSMCDILIKYLDHYNETYLT